MRWRSAPGHADRPGLLYGLGAGGRDGVSKVLEILHKELDLTMALCGRSKLAEVDEGILIR